MANGRDNISAPYWPISLKIGPEMKNHMQGTWPKRQFSHNQVGGRLPF